MSKLLIVDDESIIRKGLIVMLESMDVEFTAIYEAADGLNAVEMVEKHRPEIILVDIKMPNMDGLVFIKILKERGFKAKVIILTGHGEFEYARRSIQLGVNDYLLKPVKRIELEQALKKAAVEIKDMKDVVRHEESPVLYNTLLDLTEKEIRSLLTGSNIEANLLSKLVKYDYSKNNQGLLTAVVCGIKNGREDGNAMNSNWKDSLKMHVAKASTEALVYCDSEESAIILIRCSSSESVKIEKVLGSILSELLSRGLDITFGVSRRNPVNEIPKLLGQARAAFKEKMLFGAGRIYFTDELAVRKNKFFLDETDITKLVLLLDVGEYSAIGMKLSELFDQVVEEEAITGKGFETAACNFLLYAASHFKGKESAGVFLNDDIEELIKALNQCDTYLDSKNTLAEALIKMCITPEISGRQVQGRKVILHAKQFIHKNFNKDINLDMVAKYVSMNAAYFSVLFKKEEKTNLIDYINNIRISKAMEFLRSPQYKIYEIAESTGFKDEKYFSKLFKKKLGLSPTEYREKCIAL